MLLIAEGDNRANGENLQQSLGRTSRPGNSARMAQSSATGWWHLVPPQHTQSIRPQGHVRQGTQSKREEEGKEGWREGVMDGGMRDGGRGGGGMEGGMEGWIEGWMEA